MIKYIELFLRAKRALLIMIMYYHHVRSQLISDEFEAIAQLFTNKRNLSQWTFFPIRVTTSLSAAAPYEAISMRNINISAAACASRLTQAAM